MCIKFRYCYFCCRSDVNFKFVRFFISHSLEEGNRYGSDDNLDSRNTKLRIVYLYYQNYNTGSNFFRPRGNYTDIRLSCTNAAFFSQKVQHDIFLMQFLGSPSIIDWYLKETNKFLPFTCSCFNVVVRKDLPYNSIIYGTTRQNNINAPTTPLLTTPHPSISQSKPLPSI